MTGRELGGGDGMYTVIGYGGTRAFRLLWLLEELSLPYRHDRVMPFTDAARARTPGGRLPALQLADGTILQDSTAILTWLADHHDALTFPAGSVERARQDAWVHMVLECLDTPMMCLTLMIQRFRAETDPVVRAWVADSVDKGAERIAQELEDSGGQWLMGSSFTIADIVLGHCLHWAERYERHVSQPILRDYLARVEARPAYRTADSA